MYKRQAFDIPVSATKEAARHIDDPAQWNLEIVERPETDAAMYRTATQRRRAPRLPLDDTGIKNAISALGIQPADTEQ